MKRICHITTCHQAEDGRIFERECVSLSTRYDVTLLFPDNGEALHDYRKSGVHIIGVRKNNKWNKKWILFRQLAFLDCKLFYKMALKLDCDLYHFHDPDFLYYAKKLKKKGKKVIFDSHEDYSLQYRVYLKDQPRIIRETYALFYRYYETIVSRKIDAVIFPTTRDGVNPFENRSPKVVLCDNTPILSEVYNKYKNDYNLRKQKACYIGSLTAARGIESAIKAVSVAGGELVLAGRGDFVERMGTLNESRCVDYRGIVEHSRIAEIVNDCRVGLAALLNVGQYNLYDNLPTKAYEYMALGIPIILTKSRYNQSFIEEYKCGICVDPNDIVEYAGAIKYLFDHPDEANEMGQNGRMAVRDRFNWDKEQEKLLQLYQELM